ncbi:MAG: DNA polymerase I [Spirochaetales bacterium]|nr:DNA polymerase I [Spirochaetales bacterium]
MEKEPVYLIDGYSLIYRAYYVHLRNPLRNPKGENTSSIFGFFRSLDKLMKLKKPQYIGVIMDSTTPTFRHDMYPEYKATRQKAPPDLHAQIPRIEKILEARGIACIRKDGYEADDIIATIAGLCSAEKRPCWILSKDKDLLQLVDESVKIINLEKGFEDLVEWGREEVFKNKGLYPEQIIDYLSLMGDTSDNIPGVRGIGEKSALKLLADWKTLDNIYAHLDDIAPESQRRKLAEGRESARMSRELIVLKRDVPFYGIESLIRRPPDRMRVIELYREEDMKSFLSDLDEENVPDTGLSATAPGTYRPVTTLGEIDSWIGAAKKAGVFSFDVETDNKDAMRARPIGISLAIEKGRACYIPIHAHNVQCPDEEDIKKRIASLLEDASLRLVGQNIKYDYKVMKRWGIEIRNCYFDTMVAAWVCDATAGRYNMDTLSERHLHYKTIRYSELIPRGDSSTLEELDIAAVSDYAGEDADITLRLYHFFSNLFGEKGNEKLEKLFYETEMPLVTILAEMELNGIILDHEKLSRYGKEIDGSLIEIEKQIYRDVGHEFNIRSTKELQKVLFEELSLPRLKKTKTGYSTDSQVLEELQNQSTVAQSVLRHRILSKLKSTYVDTLPEQIIGETGRLHTHYLQTGTATGRLSSIEPNLQNIPVREDEGRRIRDAFTAARGCLFLSADYSQIELMILAHLSNDLRLIEAFSTGKDIHTHTAAVLFHEKEEEVLPAHRRVGKTINFGVIYGMSSYRLSRDLKIARADADRFISAYFTEYAGVDEFRKQTIKKAEKQGYVETLWGRRRRLPNINNPNKTVKTAEERIAVNTPIQGTAADIVKRAMISVTDACAKRNLKTKLLLQVHDELIFEVPEEEADEAGRLIKKTMEEAVPLKVPLKVSIEKGKTWGEIH